ncbi:MAG TPA: hypothetical protein VME92_01845 [Acetobacteraceae bacterium]|nr:hypothetical protein [Acetobacteraceae bacterium]
MTAPISPRVAKGGILMLDPDTAIPRGFIALQYNPDTLTRRLQPQSVGDQADRTEILRLKGPPIETISVSAEIDATDQLADPAANPVTLAAGIQPALSALELLVYPSSVELIANEALTLLGTIEILPMQSPLAVFVWNPLRVTPVRITSVEITEEAFDPNLNPIRAKVALEMRVLNVNDVGFLNPAGALYLAYQIEKEALAIANLAQTAASIPSILP